MEADLLHYLLKNAGKAVSRKAILEDVWNLHEDTDTRAIDNFIVRLRRFLNEDPAKPRHVLTVRGVGYKFIAGTRPIGLHQTLRDPVILFRRSNEVTYRIVPSQGAPYETLDDRRACDGCSACPCRAAAAQSPLDGLGQGAVRHGQRRVAQDRREGARDRLGVQADARSPHVRQIIGHIADANMAICGAAAGDKPTPSTPRRR